MTSDLFSTTLNANTESRRRFGRSISMDVIETALRTAHGGNMRAITDILRETIETDPHLGSILNKRFGAVSSLPFDIHPASGAAVERDDPILFPARRRRRLFETATCHQSNTTGRKSGCDCAGESAGFLRHVCHP